MDQGTIFQTEKHANRAKSRLWISHSIFHDKKELTAFIKENLLPSLAIVIIFVIFNIFIGRVHVENISMQPTLHSNELLMINKYAYVWGRLKCGDIIVFYRPEDKNIKYVKRVIGLPGDDILMQNGTLYVDGQSVDEPYLASPAFYNGYWHVAKDEVFVLGDNRNLSVDSHNWANGNGVPVDDIVGKAVFLYWPINKIRFFQ